jgi:hypothetical protein
MIDLMELLYNQYFSASKLYVTWDAASWHFSATLVDWLDALNSTTKRTNEGPLIELIPLPTSSQFLERRSRIDPDNTRHGLAWVAIGMRDV